MFKDLIHCVNSWRNEILVVCCRFCALFCSIVAKYSNERNQKFNKNLSIAIQSNDIVAINQQLQSMKNLAIENREFDQLDSIVNPVRKTLSLTRSLNCACLRLIARSWQCAQIR